jgi:hypothetical protein
MFYKRDMYKGKFVVYQCDKSFDFNLGSENEPRMVNIGNGTTKAKIDGILDIIREFKDIFAWTYEDMNSYRGDFIQHAIPLTRGDKPFKHKLWHIKPKLSTQIQKELQKIVDTRIIAPIRYSSWMSNLVIIQKNNGDIRLCFNFRNLNQLSLKDNYPLPNMEHLLQRVTGVIMMSMLDGF